VSFLVVVPRTSAATARASWSISIGARDRGWDEAGLRVVRKLSGMRAARLCAVEFLRPLVLEEQGDDADRRGGGSCFPAGSGSVLVREAVPGAGQVSPGFCGWCLLRVADAPPWPFTRGHQNRAGSAGLGGRLSE